MLDFKVLAILLGDPTPPICEHNNSNKELIKLREMIKKRIKEIDDNLSVHDIHISSKKENRLYFDLVMPYSYHKKSKQIIDIVEKANKGLDKKEY